MAVLAALAAAGCSSVRGSSSAAATAGPPEKRDLTVAAVPTSDSAGLYVAADRGYFAREGLHVTIVPARSSSTVIAQQLAGKLDVTVGNYVSYIRAAALQGARLKLLAAASVMQPNTQMVLVPPGSPISSVQQLKGKRIAVNVQDNIGTVLVGSVLTSNAILPSASGVRYVAVPFPKMIAELQSHQVDAAWMPEPFVTEAEEAIGAQPLVDADQGVTQNLPIAGYAVTQAWARKYPDTAAAFTRAAIMGQRAAASDPKAVAHAVVRYAQVPPGAAAILSPPAYPVRLDPAAIQRVAGLMVQFGVIPRGFSTSAMTH